MKKIITLATALAVVASCSAAKKKQQEVKPLEFNANNYTEESISVPNHGTVKYKAYTKLYYVTNVEDSTYQYLNLFVPEGATQSTPIFLPNGVGGYMASQAGTPDASAASGRALAEGYVVAIPGARGRNSVVTDKKGKSTYTGRAPKALLDLKAAVRYLRLFDKEMLGDAEKIVSNGTSAGGAMSSLLGATGNHPDYAPLLKAMGAADTRDDILAAVCFCPITDLEHADMAYEWTYSVTNGNTRPVTEAQAAVSQELAALYPAYINNLNLKTPQGTALTADNYRDYIKGLIIESAQLAKDAGADIPDTIGFTFSSKMGFQPPVNGGMMPQGMMGQRPQGAPRGDRPMRMGGPGGGKQVGEYITGLDLDKYLNYVVTTIALKTPSAFDSKGVAGGNASGENEEFGDATGSSVNFTDFGLQHATGNASAVVADDIKRNVRLLNPMNYIDDPQADTAPHWYIRHGARDRDTAFPVPVNLALKLQNSGKDVDFRLPWNRGHSGDYALNELFQWIKKVTK